MKIFIGYDPREVDACHVACQSAMRHAPAGSSIEFIGMGNMMDRGLYWRPTETRDGRLYDVISQHPMATEFAISRFLTPVLAESGWALFMDGDVLVRHSLEEMLDWADPNAAVSCVQHEHHPVETRKMDGQVQSDYPRKNWSSVMLFNCDHPANQRLTLEMINTVPGRDLHRFCWLKDHEIGGLPLQYNWLAGHSLPMISPSIVHFTDGVPSMPGYEGAPYADEWRAILRARAA